jgi:hypothetical protein
MMERYVRRLVLLLVLVLIPSTATASLYRCTYDGVTRSACCCPTSTRQPKHKAPAQDTSLRVACCCTIAQITSAALAATQLSEPLSIDSAPVVRPVERVHVPSRGPSRLASIDRPRAQGDPPDTLFARRCSLLL